jgi:hypothetical protein
MSADAKPTNDATTTPPPAANGAGPQAPPESLRSNMDLARELVELEKQYPPPDEDAIFSDARWLQEHWGTAVLEPYRGTHVAVLNGAVVGHGWDSLQLQLDVARKFNVHPQRFILEYIPDPRLEVFGWPTVWFSDESDSTSSLPQ